LENLTNARTNFLNASTIAESAVADNMIAGALKSLFAVAENYPDLKANENFIQLQSRISGIENEIADRRVFYNDSVYQYIIRIQSIPDVIVARMMGYLDEEMFEVSEADKQDVVIKFD
jgi:LemA protein